MLKRLYAHNFRCFENFEFKPDGMPSSLLIGKNGAGKSTVAAVLGIMQSIGRGANRVGKLISVRDFSHNRSEIPMRFEIEVLLSGDLYRYSLALELPDKFKELRVHDEKLEVDGKQIYSRSEAHVSLSKKPSKNNAAFFVDWHLVALPIIQENSEKDPVHIFKKWLAHMVIIAPIPQLINGDSSDETLEPNKSLDNFGDWLTGLLSHYPAAYSTIESYLRTVMPDIQDFRNESLGKEAKRLLIQFKSNDAKASFRFDDLSDGEKCFFVCAVILASNKSYGPLFCFWDEPDNYLAIHEVGHFVTELRREFENHGQILATSHNEQAIQNFSAENIWILDRKNHMEPTTVRLLADMADRPKNLIASLARGEFFQ